MPQPPHPKNSGKQDLVSGIGSKGMQKEKKIFLIETFPSLKPPSVYRAERKNPA